MSSAIPACQFGFLTLTQIENGLTIFIKANKISTFSRIGDEDGEIVTCVYLDGDNIFSVFESMQDILNQLEAIHPSLR